MVVCQYFLRGDCKFGDRCRNDHPGTKPLQISTFGGNSGFGGSGFGGGGFSGVGVGSGGGFGASSKNICQHYLKGNCRFGNVCRYSHAQPATGQGIFGGQTTFGQNRNPSIFGGGNKSQPFNRNQNRFSALSSEATLGTGKQQSVFGVGKQQQSGPDTTQINQIQQTIKRDMEVWETSKQWPLSCYTYVKDESCLTGLLDFSPEEIRKEAYVAKINNKVSIYVQGLKNLLARSRQRKMELKNMNAHQLETEIRASISKRSTDFSMSTDTGIQSSGQSASINFGGSFAMSQSQSLFGSAADSPGSNLFGSPLSSPQSMESVGPFGSPNPTTGMFCSTSPSQPTSVFGSPAPLQTTGLFGNTSTSGTITGNMLFGATTSSTSPPGKQPSAGSSLFGTEVASQPAMNVFGKPSSGETSNVPGVAPSTCPFTCSETDIAAFKADKFILGQIPECPPPPELCS